MYKSKNGDQRKRINIAWMIGAILVLTIEAEVLYVPLFSSGRLPLFTDNVTY